MKNIGLNVQTEAKPDAFTVEEGSHLNFFGTAHGRICMSLSKQYFPCYQLYNLKSCEIAPRE